MALEKEFTCEIWEFPKIGDPTIVPNKVRLVFENSHMEAQQMEGSCKWCANKSANHIITTLWYMTVY